MQRPNPLRSQPLKSDIWFPCRTFKGSFPILSRDPSLFRNPPKTLGKQLLLFLRTMGNQPLQNPVDEEQVARNRAQGTQACFFLEKIGSLLKVTNF